MALSTHNPFSSVRFFRVALCLIAALFGAVACDDSDDSGNSGEVTEGEQSGEGEAGEAAASEGEESTEAGDGEGEGEEAGEGEEEGTPGQEEPQTSCDSAEIIEGAAGGFVVADAAPLAISGFEDGADLSDDPGLPAYEINLYTPEGMETIETCADGSFTTDALPNGAYVLTPRMDATSTCSTRNCPKRFPAAVAEGEVVIVTIGDSVPVIGDRVMFPARLAQLLDPLVTVDSRNVAVEGTTSAGWVPGTFNYENNLGPHIEDADVIIISLGGNDVLNYMNDPALLDNLDLALEGAEDLILEVLGNVLSIVDDVRQINPDVDFVYCLYPDYSQSAEFPWNLVDPLLGDGALGGVFELVRENIPRDSEVMLADMYAAWRGLPIDDYLFDFLHFNDLGQTLYAEFIFETLGGVLITDESELSGGTAVLGLERQYGIISIP